MSASECVKRVGRNLEQRLLAFADFVGLGRGTAGLANPGGFGNCTFRVRDMRTSKSVINCQIGGTGHTHGILVCGHSMGR